MHEVYRSFFISENNINTHTHTKSHLILRTLLFDSNDNDKRKSHLCDDVDGREGTNDRQVLKRLFKCLEMAIE